jgi:hypothetical protein
MYPQLTEQEQIIRALKGLQFDRRTHGSLFDRGSADSYYGRPRDPHYGGIGGSCLPHTTELSPEEVSEYMAGYDWNESYGDKKDWG